MAEKQNRKDDNQQWFLRINGETVFGPVSTEGLTVWAEQGRVLPGHEVSPDRKAWVQAVSLEWLDMRWFVDDGQGELRGPLNRLAAEALIKSGKVAEGAQLVSADEIDAEPNDAAEPVEKKPRDSQHDEKLRQRIQELEATVREQQERLASFTTAEASGNDQAALLKEVEAQRDAAQRRAEKAVKSGAQREEELRQQLEVLKQTLGETDEKTKRLAELEKALKQQERKTDEAASALAAREAELQQQADALKQALSEADGKTARVPELEQALREQEQKTDEAVGALILREAELEAAQDQLKDAAAQLAQTRAATKEMEARAAAAESELAGLLNDSNTRDIAYQEKITELEKMCSQPPEETARFFADQAAVYELINAEVADLATLLEQEKTQAEQLRVWTMQRQQALQERRQKLLKHLGASPDEMTRRAAREQATDPQTARMRAELENLRVMYQREAKLAESKERDWQEKMRMQEAEAVRLRTQIVLGEKKALRVQELEELVRRRERELAAERQNRNEEREQFDANQRTLLMRIEELEQSAKPTTPEEIQAAEARNVKLASWMRLKR